MAPQYKLTYFNITGTAEPIRFLFHYGEIEFEDFRIPEDKWLQYKETMPYGQLPILEYNGEIINQSCAITRYVAKLVKLTGKDELEDLKIDAMVDTIRDFLRKTAMYYYESNETTKKEKREKLIKESIPYYMERFTKQVKQNNGFIAINHLTWGDILFVATLDSISAMMELDVIENYPELQALKKKVLQIPNIKAYVETRPKTNR